MRSELGTSVRLEELLSNRRWLIFSEPFKHLIAQDVFVQPFYAKLERAFQAILDRGLSDKLDNNKFSRNMTNYDAYGIAIPDEAPFDIFLSQEMYDMLTNVFEINSTGDLTGQLHTHKIGGRNGFLHNDLNPGRFPARKPNDRTVFYNTYAYEKGGRVQGPHEQGAVRAVAVIYYLNNGAWSPGDGGETGLYTSIDAEHPAIRVPPINNLMMAFECSPFSYHAFISNLRRPRNSIIFWLHSSFDEAARRWGEENFVWWD